MAEAKRLPRYPHCFVCGRSNPSGLDMEFTATEEMVYVDVTVPESYTGFPDRVHGGIISAIVDEAMGWACTTRTGRMYYTSELTVKFRAPLPAERPVRVEARCREIKRWIGRAEGRVLGPDGAVCAEAKGTFCAVPAEQMDQVLACLEVEGPEGRRPARPEDLYPDQTAE